MSDVINIIPTWEFYTFAGILGALWGSFANVVIVRWPLEQSVVSPGSHCFSCDKPIQWYDNIPILSYLILRGRCRYCKASFSPRYAIVELFMALLAIGVLHQTFMNHLDQPGVGLILFGAWFFFMWSMLTIALIDLEHYLIPDFIVLPGILIGILLNSLLPVLGLIEPLVAAAVSYAGLRLLFIDGYQLLTGRPGMGLGDAKLLAMFGAFMGYEGVLFALFAGALQGSIVGVGMVLFRRKDGLANEPVFEEELDENGEPVEPMDESFGKARVPFGPFLALGAAEYFFIGQYVTDAYSSALLRLIHGINI